MEATEDELDPLWKDLDWAIGAMFYMGFDGTEVTPQIRTLIEDHHLGSILLTTKNLKSAQQTASLVQELQTIAHNAGHPVPLLIALDQENGGVNSLYDEDYICQFPSAMGVAATGSPELAYEVANATGKELFAVGINMIMGPVLDVLTNARYQPLGVRATGDDPQEVSQYGIAAMNGYKDAGITTCGKHFPSYGNLDFLGSSLDMPIITETLEQLSLGALVPFRNAIREGLDAMMVGGCAIANAGMNVMHACLSDQVVDDLLRNDLGFDGVTISECLEMDALSHDIGVRGGTVMAVEAGCDLVLLCRSFAVQQEAISGLKLGIENGMISRERINLSLRRILHLKSKCTSWEQALNPTGVDQLTSLHSAHLSLSTKAYDKSITIMRDKGHLLPLSNTLYPEDELLLLTPLVKPLPASAATKAVSEDREGSTEQDKAHRSSIMSGEGVFRELGRSLARQRHGKLLHTSYTANGVRPVHENLINRAAAIIIITADANRNLYQNGFTKHVAMMCSMLSAGGKKKSLIVVSVSSPYDFAMDKAIGTYVCTFDFTETAMSALVRALFGEFTPSGTLPGTLRKSRKVQKSKQSWLVEGWNKNRDSRGLLALIKTVEKMSPPNQFCPLAGATADSFELLAVMEGGQAVEESHFVVRNSSTQALFGFCSTYYYGQTGMIGALFVDPAKRNLSIGHSLHQRAMRALLQKPGIQKLQLGLGLPGIYLGIPMGDLSEGARLKRWFANNGWDILSPRLLYTLTIRNLPNWQPPDGLLQTIQRLSFAFDLIHGQENSETVLEHVRANAGPEVLELYRLALEDSKACGVVRAKSPVDGALVGTIIICRQETQLSRYLPVLQAAGDSVGGILAPVVPNSPQASMVLQGLAMLGIKQNKAHRANTCVLNWVQGEERDTLLSMGFDVLDAFEELSCKPDRASLSH
ncbi:(Trans)glycosidase [Glarea lozoyensis ATCC 20868]|uniref:(Trans)glycosidase n=1 Tax=Glarea lozoyensis (strain ATCC 20868 / MF5171) TaxID=1116229 RepID=S3CTB3_GLAL2|nr:(Trans)glycosidase [Glarea lozoyensis ATCC 20868]EPE28885.1 (Trans)glycosidase [Glarea lozoyensis ATCC 20868]